MFNRSVWQLVRLRVITILIVGALVTALSAWSLARYNQQHIVAVMSESMNEAITQIKDRLESYQYGLRGARGVIVTAGDQQITREQFRKYSLTRDLDTEFPGAHGFGFIRRVAQSDEARFVLAAQADGKPDFSIRQLAPRDGPRFVIQYIEPSARNNPAIGLDIASEFNRRRAALTSMRTGKPTLTGPITLVQEKDRRAQAFLLLLPIYKSSATPDTVAEREAQLVGWSYAPLLMHKVLAKLPLKNKPTYIALRDVTLATEESPFYRSDDDGQAIVMSRRHNFDIYGRHWEIEFSIHPAFVDALHLTSPRWIIALGSLLSVLLAVLAGVLSISARRYKQIITERAHLGAIVESSADGIIGTTLEGVITSWNKGAEQIFSFKAEEVIGKRVADVLAPDSLQLQEEDILARINRGETVAHFETQRLRSSGGLIDVSISSSPIRDEHGHIIGTSKTIRDISQQKAAEAQLREMNVWLEQQVEARAGELREVNQILGSVLYAASEVSIIATDANGIIQVFNHGAELLLGYSADELVGKSTPAPLHIAEEVQARSAELTAEFGVPVEGFRVFVHKPEIDGFETREWTYVRKNGTTLPIELVATAIRDENNVVTGYLGIATDLTKRKQNEQSLRASHELTQGILDTAVQPILTIDEHGIVRTINNAGIRNFGYAAEEIIGMNVKILMPDPYHSEHDGYLARYLKEGTPRIIGIGREVTAKRRDGTLFPVQLSVGAMVVNGERRFVGMMVDISALHQQRSELISMRDQLSLASEVAALGIWMIDMRTNVLSWNDRMFALYDWPLNVRDTGLTFEHWRSRLHPDDYDAARAQTNAAVEGTSVHNLVYRIVRQDGSIRFIEAAVHAERDNTGAVIRIIGINRDITHQHEIEATLRHAKAQAEAASAAKSNFLANMSHEIRTPMNAVLGMLNILQKTELNMRQRDYTDKAYNAGRSLLSLLNDILDYSKIEAQKLELENHDFEFESLMVDLATVLDGNASTKNVEVLFNIDPSIPNNLFGDCLRLKQVLVNLSGNALKFTAAGNVIVSTSIVRRDADAIVLRFSVKDTGIGIAAEQRTRIFEGFTQAEASTSRRFGGTGLGLVISQRLVELMGGELALESEPGHGSRFWFDIPLKITAQEPIAKLVTPAKGLRVLIVDDNAVACEVLQHYATSFGWHTDIASDGAQCVARVTDAITRACRYDIVLMDWKLPDIDGFSAAKMLQQTTSADAMPILIMLTAYGRDALTTIGTLSDSRFVDFLTKPITPRQLATAVAHALSTTEAPTEIAAPARVDASRLGGLRLLLVDDNELNRFVASLLLEDEGALVSLATGGLESVAMVLENQGGYDAVLMDMQMPDIDGLEATRRIRAHADFSNLPIIAMTANVAESDREACLAAGMNAHIGKPIDADQLVATVLSLIQRPTHSPDATEKALPNPANHTDTSAIEHSKIDGLKIGESDIEEITSIIRRFGGNSNLYAKMLARLEPDIRSLIDSLEQQLAQNDATRAAATLHTIKGNAGSLGAKSLAARASSLEQQFKNAASAPFETQQKIQIVTELRRLLASGNTELHHALNTVQTDDTAAATQPLEAQQWQHKLQEILVLLESGNFKSVELVESLPNHFPSQHLAQFEQFVAQVKQLDFDAAKENLRELLERAF